MAPSVLFFALTGALQLFGWHEAHGAYRPIAIVEKLSSVHKDQVFAFGNHHEPDEPGAGAPKPDNDDKAELPTLALKIFFLMASLCLVLSTILGLWMGITQIRRRGTAWTLIGAGVLIPAVLVTLA
jgi:hypothetical protein